MSFAQEIIVTNCERHTNEAANAFCHRHCQTLCTKCLLDKHKDCINSDEVEDAIKTLKRAEKEFPEAPTTHKNLTQLYRNWKQHFDSSKRELDLSEDRLTKGLNDMRARLVEQINRLALQAIEMVNSVAAEQRAMIEHNLEKLKRFSDTLKNTEHKLNDIKSKNDISISKAMHVVNSLAQLENEFKEIEINNEDTKLMFFVSREYQHIKEKFTSFGELSLEDANKCVNQRPKGNLLSTSEAGQYYAGELGEVFKWSEKQVDECSGGNDPYVFMGSYSTAPPLCSAPPPPLPEMHPPRVSESIRNSWKYNACNTLPRIVAEKTRSVVQKSSSFNLVAGKEARMSIPQLPKRMSGPVTLPSTASQESFDDVTEDTQNDHAKRHSLADRHEQISNELDNLSKTSDDLSTLMSGKNSVSQTRSRASSMSKLSERPALVQKSSSFNMRLSIPQLPKKRNSGSAMLKSNASEENIIEALEEPQNDTPKKHNLAEKRDDTANELDSSNQGSSNSVASTARKNSVSISRDRTSSKPNLAEMRNSVQEIVEKKNSATQEIVTKTGDSADEIDTPKTPEKLLLPIKPPTLPKKRLNIAGGITVQDPNLLNHSMSSPPPQPHMFIAELNEKLKSVSKGNNLRNRTLPARPTKRNVRGSIFKFIGRSDSTSEDPDYDECHSEGEFLPNAIDSTSTGDKSASLTDLYNPPKLNELKNVCFHSESDASMESRSAMSVSSLYSNATCSSCGSQGLPRKPSIAEQMDKIFPSDESGEESKQKTMKMSQSSSADRRKSRTLAMSMVIHDSKNTRNIPASVHSLFTGITMTKSGRLFVCDLENHSVQVFDLEGMPLSVYPAVEPFHCCLVRNELIAVTSKTERLVNIFDVSGPMIELKQQQYVSTESDVFGIDFTQGFFGIACGDSVAILFETLQHYRTVKPIIVVKNKRSKPFFSDVKYVALEWSASGFYLYASEHKIDRVSCVLLGNRDKPVWSCHVGKAKSLLLCNERILVAGKGKIVILEKSKGRRLKEIHHDVPSHPIDIYQTGTWLLITKNSTSNVESRNIRRVPMP